MLENRRNIFYEDFRVAGYICVLLSQEQQKINITIFNMKINALLLSLYEKMNILHLLFQ